MIHKKHFLFHASLACLVVAMIVVLVTHLRPETQGGGGGGKDQNAYRFRNDDGSETTATFAAAENTPLAGFPINAHRRLRFGVASTETGSELLETARLQLPGGERNFSTAVVDTVNGYAYFGTFNSPASIVKVRLSDFTEVGVLALENLNLAMSSVIDTEHGFAYFGSRAQNFPNDNETIVKIDLATFTEVGSLTTANDDYFLFSAFIDAGNDFAYFGAWSTGNLYKINLATFTFEDILGTGDQLLSVAYDGADTAYFGTQTNPGRILELDLPTFSITDDNTFATDNGVVGALTIDSANNFLYAGLYSDPAKIVQIDINTLDIVDSFDFSGSDGIPLEAAIDTTGGFAYFGTSSSPGKVFRVNLTDFSDIDMLTAGAGEDGLTSVIIDPGGDTLLFGTDTDPGKIAKITLSSFTETDVLSFPVAERSIRAVAADPGNDFAYFATFTSPASVVKVQLSTMTRIDAITLGSGEDAATVALIDADAGFAYFGLQTSPAIIVKIDLGTFTQVDSLTLAPDEGPLTSATIDATGTFAYFTTQSDPGMVIKIKLSDFTEDDTLTLNTGESSARTSVLDPLNGFLYVGTETLPGIVAKIDLGTFTEVDSLTLDAASNGATASVIDPSAGFAYFATDFDNPGRIVKIDLSDFSQAAALTLQPGEIVFQNSAFIDTSTQIAYFTSTYLPLLVRIDLVDFTEDPPFNFPGNFDYVDGAAFIDPATDNAYFGTNSEPANVIKFSIASTPRNAFRLEFAERVTTCSAIGSWAQVPTVAAGQAFEMYNSTNIANGGATTNLVGLTDGNTFFKPGKTMDTASETTPISLGEQTFTEVEYSIRATTNASLAATYCFRQSDAGDDSDFNYLQYAEATITNAVAGGGGQSCNTPAVTLGFPNGGETFTASTDVAVQWSIDGCDLQTAKLLLSTDGGATYPTVIAENLVPTAGAYLWRVGANAIGTSDRIKIEVTKQGTVVADASNANFSVVASGAPGSTPVPAPYNAAAERASAPTVSADKGLPSTPNAGCPTDDVIKLPNDNDVTTWADTTVYSCGRDGKRYAFPNEKVYFTWFLDFSPIRVVSPTEMASIPFGGMVTMRPGVRLVKIQSDPKVYAVARDEVLRWLPDPETAAFHFGLDWEKLVVDVDPAFFVNYRIGTPVPSVR